MTYIQAVFGNNEFYHAYNRGVEKRTIFLNSSGFSRFILTLDYYRYKNPPVRFSFRNRPQIIKKTKDNSLLVEIVSFCLMPNHFHLLLKQVEEGGITKFMGKVLNSYTKYFNTKHHRIGSLFQGAFKAKHIESTEQLIHLSRYIHLNPLIDYLVKDLNTYNYSSYLEFISNRIGFCQKQYILSNFNNYLNYEQFVLDQEDYARSIKMIERVILRED